jgi:hypothetical protein
MPAPWVAGAQARIIGELHGQQTVNVLHFGTNSAIADQAALDTLLLQLAVAIGECALTTLIPAVTADWKLIRTDAKRVYPTASDPILSTAPANSIGQLSASSVSFTSSLLSLRTGIDGKKGRGRMFLPPPGEAEISQSAMDGPTLTLITAFATCLAGKFLGASPTTDWRLGVLSRKDLGPTGFANFDNSFRIVISLNPVADIAVMRSRRKGRGA